MKLGGKAGRENMEGKDLHNPSYGLPVSPTHMHCNILLSVKQIYTHLTGSMYTIEESSA